MLSIGQVVPHEVIGMANYNKNLFVGTGGQAGINESHFIGAAYGMERMMGRADTPLRRILNYAQDHFCRHLPVVFVLTVIGPRDDGTLAVRGLFIGDDVECFRRAAALSVKVNFTVLDEPLNKVVVYLDPEEFHSTWLGNKAIYRTRMAMADGGELVVLAPGVATFGEDARDRPPDPQVRIPDHAGDHAICRARRTDLPQNLSAAAHLIHGSSEGRFTITYCPGKLSRRRDRSRSATNTPIWTRCCAATTRKRCATAGTCCPTASGSITSATRPWGFGPIAAGWRLAARRVKLGPSPSGEG